MRLSHAGGRRVARRLQRYDAAFNGMRESSAPQHRQPCTIVSPSGPGSADLSAIGLPQQGQATIEVGLRAGLRVRRSITIPPVFFLNGAVFQTHIRSQVNGFLCGAHKVAATRSQLPRRCFDKGALRS
jgi:hypothetical protein